MALPVRKGTSGVPSPSRISRDGDTCQYQLISLGGCSAELRFALDRGLNTNISTHQPHNPDKLQHAAYARISSSKGKKSELLHLIIIITPDPNRSRLEGGAISAWATSLLLCGQCVSVYVCPMSHPTCMGNNGLTGNQVFGPSSCSPASAGKTSFILLEGDASAPPPSSSPSTSLSVHACEPQMSERPRAKKALVGHTGLMPSYLLRGLCYVLLCTYIYLSTYTGEEVNVHTA